jgi:predicted acetyltransferase
MIQQGKDKYKERLMQMWKLCFPDDANTFIDFYFNKVYKNDEVLVYIENHQPVASLQMIPYRIKTETGIAWAGYISGAMTHPDFQKKGYMGKLLKAAFDAMQAKGYGYTFLIPQENWLFDFYAKYGYSPAFPRQIATVIANEVKQSSMPLLTHISLDCFTSFAMTVPEFASIYTTYSHFLSAMPCVVLKTESQFDLILQNFFNEKGVLFANDYGIAFTFEDNNDIILKEFFYRDENTKQEFLQSIDSYYSREKMVIFEKTNAASSSYKGMIKRLNETKEPITDIYLSMMLD